MSWKGMFFGSCIGSLFGGPIGALVGAVLGHQIEKHLAGGGKYAAMPNRQRSMVFCASAAAMLAKMAKADGRVSRGEIAAVEAAFRRLGFRAMARDYAINVFRRAKDDDRSIFEYAAEFARVVESVEVRELFYEILWDIAGADGSISSGELLILQRIPRALNIRPDWYGYFYGARFRGGQRREPVDEIADAYRTLGASASDSPDELKRKYRELAKKNHPDALRAQGLPEEMVGKATERMGRINSAWATVKEARGL